MPFLIGAELYQIIQGQYKTAIRKNTCQISTCTLIKLIGFWVNLDKN
jgi:hypothetical protein